MFDSAVNRKETGSTRIFIGQCCIMCVIRRPSSSHVPASNSKTGRHRKTRIGVNVPFGRVICHSLARVERVGSLAAYYVCTGPTYLSVCPVTGQVLTVCSISQQLYFTSQYLSTLAVLLNCIIILTVVQVIYSYAFKG